MQFFDVVENEEVVEPEGEVPTPCNCPPHSSNNPCCDLSANLAVPRLTNAVKKPSVRRLQTQTATVEIPEGVYNNVQDIAPHFIIKFADLIKQTFL